MLRYPTAQLFAKKQSTGLFFYTQKALSEFDSLHLMQQKNTPKGVLFVGGGEENRTPVQKSIRQRLSECSL